MHSCRLLIVVLGSAQIALRVYSAQVLLCVSPPQVDRANVIDMNQISPVEGQAVPADSALPFLLPDQIVQVMAIAFSPSSA